MILELLSSLSRTTVLLLAGLSIILYIISQRIKASTSLPLPPGPPADSIWGNSFDAALWDVPFMSFTLMLILGYLAVTVDSNYGHKNTARYFRSGKAFRVRKRSDSSSSSCWLSIHRLWRNSNNHHWSASSSNWNHGKAWRRHFWQT